MKKIEIEVDKDIDSETGRGREREKNFFFFFRLCSAMVIAALQVGRLCSGKTEAADPHFLPIALFMALDDKRDRVQLEC